jgi:hypothetical protein
MEKPSTVGSQLSNRESKKQQDERAKITQPLVLNSKNPQHHNFRNSNVIPKK